MTRTRLTSTNALEPANCVNYALRRAARKAAKLYDHALKPSGLRNTQFAMLGALNRLGEPSIGDLSEDLAIDGTTLTRNLEILVRDRLVENLLADDARVRNVRLTKLGKKTFENAIPLWRTAQRQVLKSLEPDRWLGMREQLSEIEGACDRSG